MSAGDFEQRLQKAIERGQRKSDANARAAQQQALTEEELRQLHSRYRLQLSEHIEQCLKKLPNYFPGFQYETIYGDRGWGAACSRDDIRLDRGQRSTDYSRLEMTVRPYSGAHVLDLAAKGTIRNKELFTRNYYERLQDVDPAKYLEMIDAWALEYAELYVAKT
jgi:hypothetical protein